MPGSHFNLIPGNKESFIGTHATCNKSVYLASVHMCPKEIFPWAEVPMMAGFVRMAT